MKDEYWATFSIYDHRTSLFRQALLLFDCIVVPVPTRKYGDLTNQEIENLSRDVELLEHEGAAKKVNWDPEEFTIWKHHLQSSSFGQQEAFARQLVKDPPYATRLQMKEHIEAKISKINDPAISVTAVPVYGTKLEYEVATTDLKGYLQERVTLDVLLKAIPIPSKKVAFNDILRVKNKRSFQASLTALRKWQRQTVGELLLENNTDSIRRAADDFSNMIRKYRKALAEARYEKAETAISSMLALGGVLSALAGPLIGTLGAIASPIFSIRKLLKPCWKDLEEKQCFPAGVIFEAGRLA